MKIIGFLFLEEFSSFEERDKLCLVPAAISVTFSWLVSLVSAVFEESFLCLSLPGGGLDIFTTLIAWLLLQASAIDNLV